MVRAIHGLIGVGMALALACGGGGGTDSPAPSPGSAVTHTVAPNLTDPAISTYLNVHVTISPDPAVPAKGRLFLFLPGTGGAPSGQQLILQTGSARGYHAVGLMYPNTPSVGSLCDSSPDPNAHGDVRREIITGQDLSPLVNVNPTECLEHRLTALLTYLAATYPAEQWGQYLTAGQPDWTKVVVAGHSQGGGHAGVIAKLHPVVRAVCFSSPADWRSDVGQPASWYAPAGATPADRIYGFSHQQDPLVTWPLVTANWAALGLGAFGAAVNVDATGAPYAGSHQLTTNFFPVPGDAYHGCTVVDAGTPRLPDGSPRYRPVWIQLCFP